MYLNESLISTDEAIDDLKVETFNNILLRPNVHTETVSFLYILSCYHNKCYCIIIITCIFCLNVV